MSFVAIKYLYHCGSKTLRTNVHNILRMSSTEEPCSSSTPPCGTCPTTPACPPVTCPPYLDPNNPCNYIPPPILDPDYPDMTKIKRLQCKFQENNDLPVHLKGGKFDFFLYQTTLVLTFLGFLGACMSLYKLINK